MGQNNDRWNAGSAKQLAGEVVTLIAFISTPDNSWNDKDKEAIIEELVEGETWLSEQAHNWGVDLRFKQYLLNNGNDIVFNKIEKLTAKDKRRGSWVYRTLKKLGYRNSKQAYAELKEKYKCDNFQVIVLANKKGHPYAMRYAKGKSKRKKLVEGLIIFPEFENGVQMTVAATHAHELLHLYGAWDLYEHFAQTLDRHQKAQELYPDDIMLKVDYSITNLNVNKLTAWLVGWNQEEEEIFEWFRPSNYSK